MKRWLVVAVALFVLVVPLAEEAAAKSRIYPTGDVDPIRIKVGGKRSTYHIATQDNPFAFKLRGTQTIRILSRLLYPGMAQADSTRYRLRVEIDGVELRTFGEETTMSRGASRPDGRPVGTLERSSLRIPSGTHRVLIYPADAGTRVALRVFRGSGKPKKIAWVSYEPEKFERSVLLHTRDTETTYYRFGVDRPVSLTLHGPLTMKVRTRLDFGHERGYYQTYAIRCFVDDELRRTETHKARASHTSTYPDLAEIMPGVAMDFEVDIPDGVHTITLTLDCTTARSASLRILIPEKSVTNGR